MLRSVLVRLTDDGKQTLGRWEVFDESEERASFATLEPAWKANKRSVSCIPAGRYALAKRTSKKYGEHLHLTDVESRDWILVHRGNYRTDTTGCVLIGSEHRDINGDGIPDVIRSASAMAALVNLLPELSTLDIVDVP